MTRRGISPAGPRIARVCACGSRTIAPNVPCPAARAARICAGVCEVSGGICASIFSSVSFAARVAGSMASG
jgi:hypothetical protein